MSNMPPPPPPPPGYTEHAGGPVEKKNGLGIASLVLGILAILGIITVFLGILFGLIGAILGFIARGRVKRGEADNGGVALAGVITSLIGLVVSIALIVIGVIWLSDDIDSLNECVSEANSQADEDQCAEDFADDIIGG